MTASPVRRRLRSKTAPACVRKSEFKIKERTGDYIVVQALDAKELQLLLAHLKRKRPRPAKMKNEGAGDSDDERKARYADRDSCISWFNIEAECPFVHQRLKKLVREGNNHWPIIKVDGRGELLCTYEDTQYAVYGPGQHFNAWHQDAFAKGNDPEDARQMTVVLMLSERGAYTGGEFQAKVKMPIRKVTRSISLDAGDALLFPAKRLMHRVSKVKSGTRKTLVFWALDKKSSRYHTGGKPDIPG
ncbi:unnamed protein product [Effrenium voratum]|uniref:Fe2OG dioxygenase domain-containing protein n=1 Tax=Effrenium voratum TaxID=2562239 RepID=A0AA36JMZ9_9DINO|nr:unnamed protein product [Effrenium voratum]